MKKIIYSLVAVTIALCEVPPPYPSTGFRPSPPLLSVPNKQPQTIYGVPNPSPVNQYVPPPHLLYGVPKNSANNPSRTSSTGFRAPKPVQVYDPPQRINNYPQKFPLPAKIINGVLRPFDLDKQQNPIYGAPNKPQTPNNLAEPQQTYGAPFNKPSTLFEAPYNKPFNTNNFDKPEEIYGAPSNKPSTQYGIPNNRPSITNNFAPPSNKPPNQYGIPNINSVETLERIRQLHQLLESKKAAGASQLDNRLPTTQYLPVREPVNFKTAAYVTGSQLAVNEGNSYINPQLELNRQYLPVKDASNFRQGFDSNNFATNYVVPNRPHKSNSLSGSNINNIQSPNQQYLPSREPSNFKQSFGLQQNILSFNNNQLPQKSQISNQNISPFGSDKGYSQYVPPTQNVNPFGPNSNSQYVPTTQNNRRPQNVPNNNDNFQYVPPNRSAIEIQKVEVKNLYSPSVSTSSPINNIANGNFGSVPTENPRAQSVTDRYIPPTTTASPVSRQPPRAVTTPSPTEAPNDDEEEQPADSDDEPVGPNIAIATAVAGTPQQQFFLLQPDGRFQRVTYQRTQAEDDLPSEYTANYYFQNIQPDPNAMYAPLITIGK